MPAKGGLLRRGVAVRSSVITAWHPAPLDSVNDEGCRPVERPRAENVASTTVAVRAVAGRGADPKHLAAELWAIICMRNRHAEHDLGPVVGIVWQGPPARPRRLVGP